MGTLSSEELPPYPTLGCPGARTLTRQNPGRQGPQMGHRECGRAGPPPGTTMSPAVCPSVQAEEEELTPRPCGGHGGNGEEASRGEGAGDGPAAWTPAPGTASCGPPTAPPSRSPCPAPPRAQPTAGTPCLLRGSPFFPAGLTPGPPRCQIGGSGREHTSRASGDVRLGSRAGAGAAATITDCELLFRLTGHLLPRTLAWPLAVNQPRPRHLWSWTGMAPISQGAGGRRTPAPLPATVSRGLECLPVRCGLGPGGLCSGQWAPQGRGVGGRLPSAHCAGPGEPGPQGQAEKGRHAADLTPG